MAWHPLPDGSTHCDICNEEFRRPLSCSCPQSARVASAAAVIGRYEAMTRAAAKRDKMLTRLGAEFEVARAVTLARREAKFYRAARDRSVEAGNVNDAIRWSTLAESADGRADKSTGRLLTMVQDRERRADLERQERLAEQVTGRGATRAVA